MIRIELIPFPFQGIAITISATSTIEPVLGFEPRVSRLQGEGFTVKLYQAYAENHRIELQSRS
jgi:hypothetical protein